VTDWGGTPRSLPGSTFGPPRRPVASRALARESPLRRLDWVLLLAVLALSILGSLLVWSATRSHQEQLGADPAYYFKRHLVNLVIGLVLGMVTMLFDYRALRAYAPFVYVGSVFGLLAVLAVGRTINGSHSWIVLPAGFQIQPSEFAKVAIVVGGAMLLGEKRDGEDEPRLSDIFQMLLLVALPVALIMLQPDLGTVMVVVFILFGMLAVSNVSAKWLVGLLVAGVIGAALVIQVGLLKDYQINRFKAFANPTADTRSVSYNQNQAKITIGAGGVFGKGLFHGTQTEGQFVPEQQTDFVFTVAGEELGLIGAGGIIALLGIVLLRGLRIANRAEDSFGRLVATGVVCWFAFQGFENIGMTLGIMPVTGLPLPFVSYGGSAMFANLIAIGLLQNVHMHREK
jgi:rod shape determining protein RodA